MDDMTQSGLEDKAVGAFLGAAIGDALGWPQEQNSRNTKRVRRQAAVLEFRPWNRRSGGQFYPFEEAIQAGEYSDDTQLLLATGRCLKYGARWIQALCQFELPFWLSYQRGGGGATKRAASCWLAGEAPWVKPDSASRYFQAGGNGVAMRITPHVFTRGQSLPDLLRQVMLNGITTHGHPRALVGALAYAYALWVASRSSETLQYGWLVNKVIDDVEEWSVLPTWEDGYHEWLAEAEKAFSAEYRSAWDGAVAELLVGLRHVQTALRKGALALDQDVLQQLGAFDPKINGSGTTTTAIVLYLASRYAADPTTGILEAAFAQGTDSDTNASMVGGLFGAIRGSEWIHPVWRRVQDSSYIASLAQSLLHEPVMIERGIPKWDKRDEAELFKSLSKRGSFEVALNVLGNAKIAAMTKHYSSSKSTQVTTWRVTSEEGQTLIFTKLGRAPAEGAENPSSAMHGGGTVSAFPQPSEPEGYGTNRLLRLFEELEPSFPPQMTASQAFETLAEVVRQLGLIQRELKTRPDASLPERDAWFRQLLDTNPRLGRHLTVRELKHVVKRLFEYLD